MAYETNRYFKQYIENNGYISERIKRWIDVSSDELYAFIGFLLLLGVNKRDSLFYHWSDNELLSSIVKNYILMNKYQLIWRFLHLYDNNSNENNKESSLNKNQILINYLEIKWTKLHYPSQHLVIDESIIHFCGRTYLRQYCPQKPKKYGVKAWALAETNSGYMLRFSIYEGKKTKKEEKLSLQVIKSLLEKYKGKNYCIITDSFYSSLDVIKFMNDQSFIYIGIVNINRLKMNTLMKNTNINKGESIFYQKDEIALCKFKDKRELYLPTNIKYNLIISDTSYDKNIKIEIDIEKPYILKKYGDLMKRVDINNQHCSYFCFEYVQNKW